mmetsp:Transcript_3761/g.11946  ORF Transcript_3761/g.11946 Transcript_3761/m.11946 type:complete len:106 (-) Transcript_3761:1273-1590(-)
MPGGTVSGGKPPSGGAPGVDVPSSRGPGGIAPDPNAPDGTIPKAGTDEATPLSWRSNSRWSAGRAAPCVHGEEAPSNVLLAFGLPLAHDLPGKVVSESRLSMSSS